MSFDYCRDCGMVTNDTLEGHRFGSWMHYERTGDNRSRYFVPGVERRTRPDPAAVRRMAASAASKLGR